MVSPISVESKNIKLIGTESRMVFAREGKGALGRGGRGGRNADI